MLADEALIMKASAAPYGELRLRTLPNPARRTRRRKVALQVRFGPSAARHDRGRRQLHVPHAVVDLRESAAGKGVAMAARCASRDLYDAWRLLHIRGLDWKQVKLATLAIRAATRDLNWRTASLDGYSYDTNELRGKLLTVVKSDMFDKDGRPKPGASSCWPNGKNDWRPCSNMIAARCRSLMLSTKRDGSTSAVSKAMPPSSTR